MISELINYEDGRRRWHTQVHGKTQLDGTGVYFWVGNFRDKQDLNRQLRTRQSLDENALDHLINARSAFGEHMPIGNRTYEWSPDSGKVNHSSVLLGCGDMWLGVTELPLPTDWTSPTSKWNRWSHLMHWGEDWNSSRRIPSPDKVIQIARALTSIYPDDLRGFSEELVSVLRLRKRVDRDLLSWYFPWLDPNMGRTIIAKD